MSYKGHQLSDEALALFIDPVEVIEEQQRRAIRAARLHQSLHEFEQAPLADSGVHRRQRFCRVRHTEKVTGEENVVPQRVVQEHEAPGDLLARTCRIVGFVDAEESSCQLEDREHWNDAAVRRAVGFQDGDTASAAAIHEFETEPALPHSSLAHDARDLTFSFDGTGQRRLENLELALSADEPREAARLRERESGLYVSDAFESMYANE